MQTTTLLLRCSHPSPKPRSEPVLGPGLQRGLHPRLLSPVDLCQHLKMKMTVTMTMMPMKILRLQSKADGCSKPILLLAV